jgi:hypothetical protein
MLSEYLANEKCLNIFFTKRLIRGKVFRTPQYMASFDIPIILRENAF